MSKIKQPPLEKAMTRVSEQRKWIEDNGGDLSGYIARYGDPDVPTADGKPMYGDGGTKIYQADTDRLKKLEDELQREHNNQRKYKNCCASGYQIWCVALSNKKEQ